jgi:hypothetical protein
MFSIGVYKTGTFHKLFLFLPSVENSYSVGPVRVLQGGSNMTGTDLCINKLPCTAAMQP